MCVKISYLILIGIFLLKTLDYCLRVIGLVNSYNCLIHLYDDNLNKNTCFLSIYT